MDIRKASPKFLFSLAKNFISSFDITYEDTESTYFDSYETTEYSDEVYRFLKERGLCKYRGDEIDKFFFSFIKKNRDLLFEEEPITDYSLLEIPQIKHYKFDWQVVMVQTVNATYEHSHSSYLDIDDAEEEVRYAKDQGDIYHDAGREKNYDINNVETEDENIRNFQEVRK